MSIDLYPAHLKAIEERRRQLLVLLSRSKEQRDLEDDPKRQLKLEQTIADSEQKLEQATTDQVARQTSPFRAGRIARAV